MMLALGLSIAALISRINAAYDHFDTLDSELKINRTKCRDLKNRVSGVITSLTRLQNLNNAATIPQEHIDQMSIVINDIQRFIEASCTSTFFSRVNKCLHPDTINAEVDGLNTALTQALRDLESDLIIDQSGRMDALQSSVAAMHRFLQPLVDEHGLVNAFVAKQLKKRLARHLTVPLFGGVSVSFAAIHIERNLQQQLVDENSRLTFAPISLDALFPTHPTVNLIAEAGYGKSMHVKYILHEWIEGRLWSDYQWVFFFPLKEIVARYDRSRSYCLAEILHEEYLKQMGASLAAAHDFCRVLEARRDSILILVDGKDETAHPIVDTILAFPFNRLVVGRKYARWQEAEATVVLPEFSDSEMMSYIEKLFVWFNSDAAPRLFERGARVEHRSGDDLPLWLNEHLDVKALCRRPFMLQVVCELWRDSRVTLFEETVFNSNKLYQAIVEKIILAYLDDHQVELGITTADMSREQLLQVPQCKNVILYTAYLALASVANNQPVFDSQLMDQVFRQHGELAIHPDILRNMKQLGLLRLADELNESTNSPLEFVHLNIRDYLAGVGLAESLSSEAAEQFIRENKFDPNMLAVLENTAAYLANQPNKLHQFFALLDAPLEDLYGHYYWQLKIRCAEACGWAEGITERDNLVNYIKEHFYDLKELLSECPMACEVTEVYEVCHRNITEYVRTTDELARTYNVEDKNFGSFVRCTNSRTLAAIQTEERSKVVKQCRDSFMVLSVLPENQHHPIIGIVNELFPSKDETYVLSSEYWMKRSDLSFLLWNFGQYNYEVLGRIQMFEWLQTLAKTNIQVGIGDLRINDRLFERPLEVHEVAIIFDILSHWLDCYEECQCLFDAAEYHFKKITIAPNAVEEAVNILLPWLQEESFLSKKCTCAFNLLNQMELSEEQALACYQALKARPQVSEDNLPESIIDMLVKFACYSSCSHDIYDMLCRLVASETTEDNRKKSYYLMLQIFDVPEINLEAHKQFLETHAEHASLPVKIVSRRLYPSSSSGYTMRQFDEDNVTALLISYEYFSHQDADGQPVFDEGIEVAYGGHGLLSLAESYRRQDSDEFLQFLGEQLIKFAIVPPSQFMQRIDLIREFELTVIPSCEVPDEVSVALVQWLVEHDAYENFHFASEPIFKFKAESTVKVLTALTASFQDHPHVYSAYLFDQLVFSGENMDEVIVIVKQWYEIGFVLQANELMMRNYTVFLSHDPNFFLSKMSELSVNNCFDQYPLFAFNLLPYLIQSYGQRDEADTTETPQGLLVPIETMFECIKMHHEKFQENALWRLGNRFIWIQDGVRYEAECPDPDRLEANIRDISSSQAPVHERDWEPQSDLWRRLIDKQTAQSAVPLQPV